MIFYHIGYYLKKYDLINYFYQRSWLYFFVSCIWVYAIYRGGLEIAIRNYGEYAVAIGGAVCASVLLYMASRFVMQIPIPCMIRFLKLTGQSTLYILIIHTLFNGFIYYHISKLFVQGQFMNLFALVMIQIVAGDLIAVLIGKIKKRLN